MTDIQVLNLAKDMAGVFGVKIDEGIVLNNMHSRNAIMPVVVSGPLVTIWIDRQCVKFCEHDDIDVIYVYITRQYAKDELRRAMDLLNDVNTQNEFVSLTGATRQLRRALAFMDENGSDYYVFSDEIPW